MITFKCKMCGGDLEFEQGASVAECPYCGTTQTLPKLDDDKRANMYDRANHFRRQNEFDKAMSIYEQILQEDRSDAEAYWSLVLCRYGIEYVEDPVSHKRVPTVNRVQYASILADEDYKSALQYADTIQRGVYEAEANAIAEIQKGILDISKKEKPFDVFICYKETDANGRRTPDSVLANDMYHQLTKEGFKVFFSRITLEDKIGTAYEPYIFAALNSAKVMVVLGTKPEYFNAVWVKNEWNRYLALIRAGADKTLVPAYRDMDPYDLPDEFAHLQAQDMGKLGFMQDLIRGIKKILQKDVQKPQTVTQPSPSLTGNIAPLLERAFMFLEDGDFERADEFCEQVLNLDPKNGRAYLGKLMVALQVRKENDLKNQPCPFDGDSNYQKIMRFGDDALKKQLEDDIQFIKNRNEYNRQKGIFDKAVETLQKAQTVDACVEAMREFNTIPGFDGVQQQLAACTTKIEQINQANYQSAESMMRNGKYNDAIRAFQALQGYRDSREKIMECEECIRSEAYTRAKDWQNKKQWDDAASAFEKLGDYRDSQQRAKNCREAKATEQKAEDDRRERERQQAEARAKAEAAKKRRNTKIVITMIALAIVVGVLYIKVIKPNNTYNSAMKTMNEGNYDEATQLFDSLGAYRDASTQVQESQYRKGIEILAKHEYTDAIALFTAISGYRDAESLAKQANADNLFMNKQYSDAYTIYASLDAYYNTHEDDYARIYNEGLELLTSGDYDQANNIFRSINGYKDADTKAKETQYQKGSALMDNGQYDEATKVFRSISGYNDADMRAQESQYKKGIIQLNSRDYDGATETFRSISGYSDANLLAKESQYQKASSLNELGNYYAAYITYIALGDYKDAGDIISNDKNLSYFAQFEIGNTIMLGNYEQDNNTNNGTEAIEWIVLDKENSSVVLISKYGLDYHSNSFSIRDKNEWYDGEMYRWLNSEFKTSAFKKDEQHKISKITLMSQYEAEYKYFSSASDRLCKPTAYCIARADTEWECNTSGCSWELSGRGIFANYGRYVTRGGEVESSTQHSGVVRPLIVVELDA